MIKILLGGKAKERSVQYRGCLTVWKKLGCAEKDLEKLQKVFIKADRDKSGELDLFEFLMYVDLDKTPMSRRIFELFDYDGSRKMSFKEFTLAVWNFNSLDYPGLGRFTYRIFARDDGSGIDSAGVGRFVEEVFGRDNDSMPRKKVEDDLQRLRKAEGGKILCPAWEAFMVTAKTSLAPLWHLSKALQRKTLGVAAWEKLARQRAAMFGKLEWGEISKNMKALELPGDDEDLPTHEEDFWNIVKDAYHTFERDKVLKLANVRPALDWFATALSRACGSRGDEHPIFVDVSLVSFEVGELNAAKIAAKKREPHLTADEWEGCFRVVWQGKEARRKALEDVQPPAKRSRYRRKKRRNAQSDGAAKKERVDFVVPPRAHVPVTRPQSAGSVRDQTAFDKLVKEECAVIQERRMTRRVTYAHWCRHDGDTFHVEAADANVGDGRRRAPKGHAFFAPANNDRAGKLNEGADHYGGDRQYVSAPQHQRWVHGMPKNDYLDFRRHQHHQQNRPKSMVASSALSVATGGSGSVTAANHSRMSAGASSYSDPSLRCGRGGVDIPWILRGPPTRSTTTRSTRSGGSSLPSSQGSQRRRPQSAGAARRSVAW